MTRLSFDELREKEAARIAKKRKRKAYADERAALRPEFDPTEPFKVRMCPGGHEAILNTPEQEKALRIELVQRCKGICECGCGQLLMSTGMHGHHFRGKGMGGARTCDHIDCRQALTPACHTEAHKHRLGEPYRSKRGN